MGPERETAPGDRSAAGISHRLGGRYIVHGAGVVHWADCEVGGGIWC